MVVQYTGHTHALVWSRNMGTMTSCGRLDKHGKSTNYNDLLHGAELNVRMTRFGNGYRGTFIRHDCVHWILGITYKSLCMVGSRLLYFHFGSTYARDLSKTKATIYLTWESHMCRKPDSLVFFYLIYFYIYGGIFFLFWFVVLKEETTLNM